MRDALGLRAELLAHCRGRQAALESSEFVRAPSLAMLPAARLGLLACLREIHVALERALATAPHVLIAEMWRPELGRLALLELDIADWTRRRPQLQAESFAMAQHSARGFSARLLADAHLHPGSLLGPLFVLFASGVPTRVLAPLRDHVEPDASNTYLEACRYSDPKLCARLDRLTLDARDRARATNAADVCYRAVLDILDNLASSLRKTAYAPHSVEREPSQ